MPNPTPPRTPEPSELARRAGKPRRKLKQYATVIHLYADVSAGRRGEVRKRWTTPHGVGWTRLFFGKNLGGQRLNMEFPDNCLRFEDFE